MGATRSEVGLEDLLILSELAGRSGPIGMLGIVNRTNTMAAFVSSYLRCDIGDGSGDDPPMLFAIPLDFGPASRQIMSGVSVFDLFIQGFNYGRDPTPASRRSLEYIFTMTKIRALEFVKEKNKGDADKFLKCTLSLLQSVIDLPDNDLISPPDIFGVLDESFHYSIRVKLLSGNGQLLRQRLSLNSLEASQWLANYFVGTENALMDKVREAFEHR